MSLFQKCQQIGRDIESIFSNKVVTGYKKIHKCRQYMNQVMQADQLILTLHATQLASGSSSYSKRNYHR